MEKFQPVLLNVWQEACRHIEINEMVQKIAPLLRNDIPVDQVMIRRIDSNEGFLDTVALGFTGPRHLQPPAHSTCSKEAIKKLLNWCTRAEVFHHRADDPVQTPAQAVLPAGAQRDALIGPLGNPGECRAVLALIAGSNDSFNARHLKLAQALLDPFSVAHENDIRLHELTTLREAAEADKRSLLSRIGREELGDTIIGSDAGLRVAMERVEQVSRLNVPVLILGETGSGKELIARAIHRRSPRSSGAFIRVNCGAIPAELIDSQLFGHERGAFTGATETRKGWFERADGGTLFLDEIGELPAAAQVRLLRILQDGWLERVGGQRPIHVDARIVAATHRDLAAEVARKNFREDLWYRISTFPIRLPSLRERPDDIPKIARHFAERAATRFGLCCVMPTQNQVRLLSSYHWPGNVRELAAVIDRAAILGNGVTLEVETALGVTESSSLMPALHYDAPENAEQPTGMLPLQEAVKKHIETALATTGGRVEGHGGAAALLKINPNTLRAKMRKLQIEWRTFKSV
jgi:transcriptional regulator with GAF, ATPase, and Fis domain